MSCWHGVLWATIKVQLAYVHNIGESQVLKGSALSPGSEGFIPETQSEDEMEKIFQTNHYMFLMGNIGKRQTDRQTVR